MLNRITLQGRLARDPERKTTPNGTSVCDFLIAVGRNVKDSSGNYGTDFFYCVAWRGCADFVATHFKKGDMIVIDGRMENQQYTNSNGEKRDSWKVQVDNANLCGGSAAPKTESAAPETESVDEPAPVENEDQGLPFEV